MKNPYVWKKKESKSFHSNFVVIIGRLLGFVGFFVFNDSEWLPELRIRK